MKRYLNVNMVGVVLVAGAFVYSLFDITFKERDLERPVSSKDVVRFLHWQLEPGFREALDAVIDDYNRLPHVVEAGYRVEQMAISEKVYPQFVNVHLISGTAPDLVCLGKSTMAENKSRFFDPLSGFVQEPNPYNSEERLPEDLDPKLREHLRTAPWRETFIDGLNSTWDPQLGNYYGVSVASWGTVRMYYNKKMIARAKELLRGELARTDEQREPWFKEVFFNGDQSSGYLPLDQRVREWIAHDGPPETMGQLILLSEGLLELGRRTGNEKLVPIAGSSYSVDMFEERYATAFTYAYEEEIDYTLDSGMDLLEVLDAWVDGSWRLDDERMRAYYECLRTLADYFPPGFVGLDREQANRRFILGNAAMLATGAWDAGGIFRGARNRAREADRFEIGIINFPVPAENERWGEFRPMPVGETGGTVGVPMALYSFSQHKAEAIDFLRYLTSFGPNEKLIRKAGWLPVTLGPEPTDQMKPFLPERRGVHGHMRIKLEGGGNVETVYNGQLLLFIGGDTTYEDFVANVNNAIADPHNGWERQWYEINRRRRESTRNVERNLSILQLRLLDSEENSAEERAFKVDTYSSVFSRSIHGLNGESLRQLWEFSHPNKFFPEY